MSDSAQRYRARVDSRCEGWIDRTYRQKEINAEHLCTRLIANKYFFVGNNYLRGNILHFCISKMT